MRSLIPLLLCGLSLTGAPAFAQTPISPGPMAPRSQAPSPTSLTIDAGSGQVIQTGRAITNLFAADPKVAEVRPASPTSVFVFGVAPGRTTIAALDQGGNVIGRYEVTVRPSAYGAAATQAALHQALPHSNVSVQTSVNGLTLTGQVSNPAEAAQADSIARGFLGDKMTLDNRLTVGASVQVNLRVRIAEISRQVTRRFGINWAALGSIGKYGIVGASIFDPFNSPASPAHQLLGGYKDSNLSIDALLDLLAADNLATILAEPNLTAMSGETASFLSGGEYPIPVAQQNNTITIEYKQYGISLAFVPTVLGSDHISLHVRPEVSQLSTQGAIQLGVGNSTISVPALTVRRADTSVELGSGQSFAIAGLLSAQNTLGNNGLPYIGEAPIIGSLFRSDNIQRNDSELVIIITPYIVRPVDDPKQLRAPTDDYRVPHDYDRVTLNRQMARGTPEVISAHLPGDAGFILN
nr:type II and III secretion system protein family protein [uncultured Rhodopila sp.]